jgi:hypothetical protein
MRTLVAVLSVLFIASCNGGGPPGPEPTPTPSHTPECQALLDEGLHWCVPDECSADCVHNPTTDPRACERCKPAPSPSPEPTPSPSPGECAEEAQLVATTCGGAVFNATVKQATDSLGDLTGNDPQDNLKALAQRVKEQTGRECVFAGVEALFLKRPDDKYEENHAVYFGNGSWTNSGFGKFIGCHTVNPNPPPGACTDPDPRGRPAIFTLKPHHQYWDSTFKIYKDYDYCVAAGFVGRGTCPVRPEGAEDREACEAAVIGVQQWQCDGAPITRLCDTNDDPCINPGNRAQAKCFGHVKTCTQDGVTCEEADW